MVSSDKSFRVLWLRQDRFCIEDSVKQFRGHDTLVDHHGDTGKFPQGIACTDKQTEEDQQVGDGHWRVANTQEEEVRLFVDDEVSTCTDGDSDHRHTDEFCEGFSETGPEDHFQLDSFHLLRALAEAIAFVFFHREGLNGEYIAEGFEEDFVKSGIAPEDACCRPTDTSVEEDYEGDKKWS